METANEISLWIIKRSAYYDLKMVSPFSENDIDTPIHLRVEAYN